MSNNKAPLDFGEALDDALTAVRVLHDGAARLSASVGAEKPDAVRSEAVAFEDNVQTAKPALERFFRVLRDARHHTLESAYRALMDTPGREAEAAQMREIIQEFREVRAIINAAGRRIDTTLSNIEGADWGGEQQTASGVRVTSLA